MPAGTIGSAEGVGEREPEDGPVDATVLDVEQVVDHRLISKLVQERGVKVHRSVGDEENSSRARRVGDGLWKEESERGGGGVGETTHGEVAVVAGISVHLELHSIRQTFRDSLTDGEAGTEGVVEGGRRVVIANEGILSQSCHRVDDLREDRGERLRTGVRKRAEVNAPTGSSTQFHPPNERWRGLQGRPAVRTGRRRCGEIGERRLGARELKREKGQLEQKRKRGKRTNRGSWCRAPSSPEDSYPVDRR